MPPKQSAAKQEPSFSKDERVLCFHLDLLYEAKIMDVKTPAETGTGEGYLYKVHYKGWKSSWDDWVSVDRIRKFNDENKELAAQLLAQFKSLSAGKSGNKQQKKTGLGAAAGARATGSDLSSARGSEERGAAGQPTSSGRNMRRARDYEVEHEDNFHNRPAVKIHIPDHLKAMLVDDWENVTKNQQLVPIPHHKASVNKILEDYLKHECRIREENSIELDLVEEVIAGLREYFDKCLGRILLYRFERAQYHDIYQSWTTGKDEAHRGPCDTYGAEHLARLLVSLPELIAQTNMDTQSVNRLREELTKFTSWLGKHATNYFVSEYEATSPEYIAQARNS